LRVGYRIPGKIYPHPALNQTNRPSANYGSSL
jgi:hypothetical protein